MLHPNKPFLSLSILMLFLHPIAHAESSDQSQPTHQLQNQVQQLQNQITDANGRITVLETAKNTISQDISVIQNSKKLEHKSDAATATANIRRTANGHGR